MSAFAGRTSSLFFNAAGDVGTQREVAGVLTIDFSNAVSFAIESDLVGQDHPVVADNSTGSLSFSVAINGWFKTSTGATTIKNAADNGTIIHCNFVTPDTGTYSGDCIVTAYNRNEPFNGAEAFSANFSFVQKPTIT